MKKLYSLLLAAALLLTMCSCASKKQIETEPTETTVPVVETTEAIIETTEATEPVETTEATEPSTEPEAPKTVTGVVINTESLNVRSDAGTGYSILAKLTRGTSVTVYEKTLVDTTYWGRIDQGWVSLEYIQLDGDLDSIPLKGTGISLSADHQHDYKKEVIQPTCTERGYNTYTCECGDTYVDNYVDALGHTWGSWTTVKEATQYATGKAERKCSRCGAVEERVLDKLIPNHTHSYTSQITTAATCTQSGVRTYTCSCGSTYTETIPKTSHSYKTQVVAPTCQSSGYTLHTCTVCGDSYKDNYTAATAHTYKTVVTAATCEKAGQTTYTCTVCGYSYTGSITAATGHSWSAWTTVTQPTVNSTGLRERSCTTCGKKETETIARLDPPVEPSTPAECNHVWEHHHEDEVGHTEYFLRCKCGATFSTNAEWEAHASSYDALEALTNHGGNSSGSTWVVDSPAKDWDVCTICGATK